MGKQTVFWKYIIYGKTARFKVVKDFWRRIEFQEQGTPHSHNLIDIEITPGGINEDSLSSTSDPEEDNHNRNLVKTSFKSIATASLQPRPNDFLDLPNDERVHEHIRELEQHFQFKADRADFKDSQHPCRESAALTDESVQTQMHTCQMHTCQNSCHKYCRPGEPLVCQYDYPKQSS